MGDTIYNQLLVNGVDKSGDLEWELTIEEVLGGVGRATLTVQDRTNSWEPQPHDEIQAIIVSSGHRLFWGEVPNLPLNLELGMPWRKWVLDCVDWNDQPSQRLVGALDGKTWIEDPPGFGVYVNIDPDATSLGTDKLTVQNLFDKYLRINGNAVDATTFVNEYLTDFAAVTWASTYLSNALEELAALIVENLQFWIDPDMKFHWVTIPSWRDLAQDYVTVSIDEAASVFALMTPEMPVAGGLEISPYVLSDSLATGIGFESLKFQFEGSNMPEQIYVRGGTGYSYNAPPIPAVEETKVVVKNPISGTPGRYTLKFLAETKLWHVDSTGYIALAFDLFGPSDTEFEVKWVEVPWHIVRNKGGHFWKLLTGPNAGKLVDNDTNVLSGYGEILVQKISTSGGELADPEVGTGGSGWVGSIDQDRNKRQAYLDAAISTTKAQRDAIGGQALYRASYPTLRGTATKVRGYDGWRVGQLVKVIDARLPAWLNNKYYVIQRVRTKLVAENDLREYDLDFGDGPTSRWSADAQGGDDGSFPPPAIMIDVKVHDLSPGPNTVQAIEGRLVNGRGEAWALGGKTVNWYHEAYNSLGVLQTGQGSISPTVSITDKNGVARTKLTSGPTAGLVYYVFAFVVVE